MCLRTMPRVNPFSSWDARKRRVLLVLLPLSIKLAHSLLPIFIEIPKKRCLIVIYGETCKTHGTTPNKLFGFSSYTNQPSSINQASVKRRYSYSFKEVGEEGVSEEMAMTLRAFVLFVLSTLVLCGNPTSLSSSSVEPFWIAGKVYCDTCRCGFETPASTYIEGARVRVECRDWDTSRITFSQEATTDSSGQWEMKVEEDHQDEQCSAVLLTSSLPDCKTADPGRSRASLVLTRENGVVSNRHPANAMGFFRDQRLPECEAVLAMYPPLDSY